jgi:hypothetical protein
LGLLVGDGGPEGEFDSDAGDDVSEAMGLYLLSSFPRMELSHCFARLARRDIILGGVVESIGPSFVSCSGINGLISAPLELPADLLVSFSSAGLL